MTATEKMKLAARFLGSKKARDISVLQVTGVTLLADYFIVCSASSTTQVKALASGLEEAMENAGEQLFVKEGTQGLNWILLDYSDILVHVFDKESRGFYDLERMWRDGKFVDIADFVTVQSQAD